MSGAGTAIVTAVLLTWCAVGLGRAAASARAGHQLRGPALSGRSPTYIVRQLYDIQSGARSGPTTEQMKPIAGQLTLQEMIDIAAYIGSKTP